MDYIGKSITRIDAESKAIGRALFPGDFTFPGQLFMKVLFANRPHAIIESIDKTEAEALDGVVAVLTAQDVPHNVYGLIIPDQPVLCGPGSDHPYADRVRFIGDQVALIIAESETIAIAARDLMKIEYKDLPVVGSLDVAMEENAPILHPDKESNVFCSYTIKQGDVEAAFSKCDVVVEGTYLTPVQEHAYLQPEAGVGYLDEEGRITIIVGGQCTHEDQHQIAQALGLPEEKIRVIYPAIGGAFGGREDVSVQIILALAVFCLYERGIDRPVKIVWTREESIIGHSKRHHYQMYAKWGATRDGKIIAARIDVYGDGGAYAYTSTKVLGNTALMSPGPYEIPNVQVNASVVHTNNIPAGAFRGFGGPQGAFVAEMQVNKLAEALNMDRVEIRLRNLFKDGSILSVGSHLPEGVSICEVVKELAEYSGWDHKRDVWERPQKNVKCLAGHIKRGLGFACGFKNVGYSSGAPESCIAKIELQGKAQVEKAVLFHAGAEIGQGSHTIFKQLAADSLDLPLDKVELVASDTSTAGYAGSVSASRMTFMAGNAIRGAAVKALEKWRQEERPAVGEFVYNAPETTLFDPETGKSNPNFAYGYVAEVVDLEVDTETGEVRILKVICANDVGKAINPQQIVGQIEGAVVQAAGYTLLENFIQNNGYVHTNMLSSYLIPTALDVPEEIDSLILEYPDPIGPYGARGMGEMPFMPLAPAIMDAIYNATGVWFDVFPLTPERVLRGLGKIK